jgi:hypothetical protein
MDAIGRYGNRVELAALDLPDEQIEWLKSVVGPAPTFDELDRLEMNARLTADQHAILGAIVRSARGEPIGRGSVLTGAGEQAPAAVKAYKLPLVSIPKGETPRQQQLRKDMLGLEGCIPGDGWRPRSYLIGQENLLNDCVRIFKDWESPARRTPPIASIVSDRGHGERPMIEGYVRSVFGPKGSIIEVDLEGKTDERDYNALFGMGGPLELGNLKRLAGSGVLWIKGADKLKDREEAREIHKRIIKLINAKDGEPDYARTHYFFYFEGLEPGPDPRRRMREGLGPDSTETLSAACKFEHLDGPAMLEYTRDLLPEILKRHGLDKLAFQYEYDLRALEKLGEALATPHAPLLRHETRLLRLVLDKFDTHTSVDRAGSLLALTLSPDFARDDLKLREAIEALHVEDPDLFEGGKIFQIEELGRSRVDEAGRKNMLDTLGQVIDRLDRSAERLKAASKRKGASLIIESTKDLKSELSTARAYADRNEKLRFIELLPKARREALVASIERALEAVADFKRKNRPAEWDKELQAALKVADEHAALLGEAKRIALELKGQVPEATQVEFLTPQASPWGPYDPPSVRVSWSDGDPQKGQPPGWFVEVRNKFREDKPLDLRATHEDGTEIAKMAQLMPGAGKGWRLKADDKMAPGRPIRLEVPHFGFSAELELPKKGEELDSSEIPEFWHFDPQKADQIR